jgi:hypothetical protein
MTSWQIKLGRFSENSKAAALALSIKASEGLSERVRVESAGADAVGGGSGQGGRSCCLPRFKMGGASEQAGVLWDCDCVAGGGAEGDCAGCDCGEDPLCAVRAIGALRTRASRQLVLQPELTLRMTDSRDLRLRFCRFVPQTAYTRGIRLDAEGCQLKWALQSVKSAERWLLQEMPDSKRAIVIAEFLCENGKNVWQQSNTLSRQCNRNQGMKL